MYPEIKYTRCRSSYEHGDLWVMHCPHRLLHVACFRVHSSRDFLTYESRTVTNSTGPELVKNQTVSLDMLQHLLSNGTVSRPN